MIMSSPLRGRPAAFPSAISCAQISPALSSNDRMRPANSACGRSDPENHLSRTSRFLPRGFSRMPRRISATSPIILDGSLLRAAHRLPPVYIWIYIRVFMGA
jgi:hypothetical protein